MDGGTVRLSEIKRRIIFGSEGAYLLTSLEGGTLARL